MGVVTIIMLVVAIAMILIAQRDARKLAKKPVQDDTPTTVVDRGTFLQVVKGRRRLGPNFLWVGERNSIKRREGSRTTFRKAPKVTKWRESAWHALCVGPGEILWEIDMSGKIIFQGPLTKTQSPSGSTIDLGNQGSFRIFWGEDDQPVNNFFGDVDRVGIASRWPGCLYIEWRDFELGGSPSWPQLTYIVQVGPQNIKGPFVTGTDPYMQPTFVGSGSFLPVTGLVTGASPLAYFEVDNDHFDAFNVGDTFELTGNGGIPDTTYTVGNKTFHENTPFDPLDNKTRVYPLEGISLSATVSGTVEPGVNQGDDGWNGAHMIAEMLFEQWPYGAELDLSEWDAGTLQTVATALGPAGENLKCSMLSPGAPSIRQLLGAIMQDLGLLMPVNMRTGLIEFQLARKPVGTLPHIDEGMLTKVPEIKIPLGPKPMDRLVFTFPDEKGSYKDMTIVVDDDGSITIEKVFKAQTAQIISTTYFPTAAQISERRSFEALARGGEFRIWANRGARILLPGSPVTGDGFADVMRIMSIEPDPQSGRVEMILINDFYGAKLSDFVTNQGNIGSGGQKVGLDLAYMLWEMPEILARTNPQTVVLAHIKASTATQSHFIYSSEDGLTYSEVADDDTATWAGGQLNEPMGYEMEQTQGPEFTFLGPDISTVQDLTSDVSQWRRGQQLCLFADVNGDVEVCFVQKITFVSGSTYRLDGLIRARYDTRPLSLPIGTKLYIAENDEGLGIQEAWFDQDIDFYAKAIPVGAGSAQITLDRITTKKIGLYGKIIRPPAVTDITIDWGASDATGPGDTNWTDFEYSLQGSSPSDDIKFRWSYYSFLNAGTGAGQFPAGNVQVTVPEGSFLVEILNSGDVLQRSFTASDNSYTYTRADRLVDFGVEPASFKVRVSQNRGGRRSSPVTQTFTAS